MFSMSENNQGSTKYFHLQNNLWEENKLCLFKLTSGSDEFGVVLTDDYVSHIKSRVTDPSILLTIG